MSSPTRPFTAAAFNQYLAERRLMASRCTACGARHLPPRAICPRCHAAALEWVETSGRGRLVAFTSIAVVPTALAAEGHSRDNPYLTGIVQLEDGLKISARLLGFDPRNAGAIQIGAPVQAEFLTRGEGDQQTTLLAFRAAQP